MKTIIDILKRFWKPIIMVVMGLVIISQCSHIFTLNEDNARLENNYYAMCDTASKWKTKSGQLATKTKNMEVTIKELNALYAGATEEIKDLNIKIKNLEAYQKGVITKTIHDTIRLHDTIVDDHVYRTGTYKDGCVEMLFTITDTDALFDMMETDVIVVYITREKVGKWWKFWTWPRKEIYTTTATSTCPNTEVIINTCTIKK